MRGSTETLIAALLLTCLHIPVALAYEDGPPPAYSGGFGEDSCQTCHSDNRRNHRRGSLRLSGLPERLATSEEYTITITLAHEALQTAGLQLSVRLPDGNNAGELQSDDLALNANPDDGVQYLQHQSAAKPAGNPSEVSWQLRWRAPAAGERIVIHVAAVAANGDRSALGDFVYLAVADIRVATATD